MEEALVDAKPPIHLTPTTRDHDMAVQWFSQFEGAGLDGIVAKPLNGTYQPDKRVMFKIKHERTADCVVAGYRPYKGDPESIGSLLLGLYTDSGELASVGVIGAFPAARRKELFAELQPLVTTFENHPWDWAKLAETTTRNPRSSEFSRWNANKDLSFVPLRPELVVEVRYEHMEGTRFRHTAQFNRWRPDRDPSLHVRAARRPDIRPGRPRRGRRNVIAQLPTVFTGRSDGLPHPRRYAGDQFPSGTAPNASLTVAKASRKAMNTVASKISRSLNPTSRNRSTSDWVVAFGSSTTWRAQ